MGRSSSHAWFSTVNGSEVEYIACLSRARLRAATIRALVAVRKATAYNQLPKGPLRSKILAFRTKTKKVA